MTDVTASATCPAAYPVSCFAYQLTWTEAAPAGVTINVYAVTECLAKPHCLAPTTAIPAADLYPLGTAAASTGTYTFMVGDGESYGDGWVTTSTGTTVYLYAVVVQASSSSGKSPLVIAWAW
jgi:hypothetical protein